MEVDLVNSGPVTLLWDDPPSKLVAGMRRRIRGDL